MPSAPIQLLEEPFELTKAAKAIQKKCNASIVEFNAKLAKFDEKVAKATSVEDDELASLPAVVDGLEQEKLELLIEERKLRQLLGSYFNERRDSHGKATDMLRVAHEETRAKLKEGLVALGYVDGVCPGTYTASIQPGFYHTHPECRLAHQQYQACQGARESGLERLNAERIGDIDNEIRAVRERLTRIARR